MRTVLSPIYITSTHERVCLNIVARNNWVQTVLSWRSTASRIALKNCQKARAASWSI